MTSARLRSRSCMIDVEAVACDDNGIASVDLVRHLGFQQRATLPSCAPGAGGGRREAHSMRDSAQVTAPGAVTSIIVAVSTRPNRQNRSTRSRMSAPLVQKQKLRDTSC